MRVKHSIGDVVKVIDELSFHFDRVGIVDYFNEDLHWNVFVRFPDNTKCNFRHKELKSEKQNAN